jgi:hypothetical protein
MYYSIKRLFFDDSVVIDAASHFEYSLSLGRKLPDNLTVPLLFDIDTELSGTRMPSAFLRESVFSRPFLDALLRAGVDNIDAYPALIRNPDTGGIFGGEYLAVNILGRIACANLEASEYDKLADSYVMRRLVIDAKKAMRQNIFRLHENSQIILVKDTIVQQLSKDKFPDIEFDPIEESPL